MTEHTEFRSPATLIGRGAPHRSALWRDVPYRRQVWLRSLKPGDAVHVLDDYGNVHATTVRGFQPRKHRRSLEPQVWLYGHGSSYSAARIFRPGTAPMTVTP